MTGNPSTIDKSGPFVPWEWRLAHGSTITLGPRAVIMGILNVTPDSFSDGGRHTTVDSAVSHALQMVTDGADIIDIGGESTRPAAEPVDAQEEQDRVLPVIEALAARSDVLISIDSRRAETARLAVRAGAHIINDVEGLQGDPDMADTVAATGAGVVAMHTGRGREKRTDPLADQRFFVSQTIRLATDAGVEADRLVLDPGFGFAKTPVENFTLLDKFGELHALGYPLLIGTSRKRFLGKATGRKAEDRDIASIASAVMLRQAGAAIFRVHDVAGHNDALSVCDAARQPCLFDLSGEA
ncbi:dihydropteroate synthase [Notoacmeibacter sp. MSK16QG-6]|uniref:dihydropteroate synthase n=1 Tax=Notoacmeibacter sp. MSK16QG-6 TaxID=2957982 RepID=UPI0020A1265D|nr:dihydropteroate synthase [Notoacmeibacter sp. MSK16QG-6]